MPQNRRPGKLAVILHADVAGSTALVQQDEHLAHERIQDAFGRFSDIIAQYHGRVRELRGDALLAEFERASDAVGAALNFQQLHSEHLNQLRDDMRPALRIGVSLGEVVFADDTVTGAGVVLAQRIEQLATPGGLCITAAIHEALPNRMPVDQENLGEQELKGFAEPVRVYRAELKPGESISPPEESREAKSSLINWRVVSVIAAIAVVISGGVLTWLKPWDIREDPASVERAVLPLPDKPSVAVLPFDNLSDDQ
jgi:adenylate cyclase